VTRKDYEAIEYALYSRYNSYPNPSVQLGVVYGVACDIAFELEKTNKAFDREHFLAIVRGERELNSKPNRKHELIITCFHDAMAECSCGKWTYVYPGLRTRAQIEEHFKMHTRQGKTGAN